MSKENPKIIVIVLGTIDLKGFHNFNPVLLLV